MKVLVACEESQAVTIELRKIGVEAFSCDTQEQSGGFPEWHIKDDVTKYLDGDWDMIIAFPPCFEPGTLIKTIDGYKNIEDVNIGDFVLTHKNRYKEVYNKDKTFSEEIMNIKITSSKNFRVTKEHPFRVVEKAERKNEFSEPKWVKTKDLNKNHYVALPSFKGEFIDTSIKTIFGDVLPLDKENFWWVVGKWIGDGWNLIHKGCKETNICSSKKESECLEIEKKLNSIFGKFSKENQKTTVRYVLRNKSFFDFLEQFGKYCDGKFIPEFVFNLPKKLLKGLLEGYFFADGHKSKGGKEEDFTTVSKHLAYGLQLIVLKVFNKPTSFYELIPRKKIHKINGRIINQNLAYRLKFQYEYSNKIWNAPHHIEIDGIIYSKFKSSKKEEYNNFVYNLSVKDDESYVANNLVCHNCTHLASSGARHFAAKIADGRQQTAIDFFMKFTDLKCPRVAIENPIGIMSTRYRKPDQIIQPWMFGHGETKATCLWLKGLPKLIPTNIVEGRSDRIHKMPGGKNQSKNRSKTYSGIAEAMAKQYTEYYNAERISK